MGMKVVVIVESNEGIVREHISALYRTLKTQWLRGWRWRIFLTTLVFYLFWESISFDSGLLLGYVLVAPLEIALLETPVNTDG